jgi:nitric oxide reductase NorE protein
MTVSAAPHQPVSPDQPARRRGHIPGEEGVWVFILGDMVIFAILFATYMHYRSRNPEVFNRSQESLNSIFGVVNTLLLLFSSLLVVLAVGVVRKRFNGNTIAPALIVGAIACGLGFSALKVIEYAQKVDAGITPQTNDFFMFYFVLTGLHWFHLILGLAVLTYMLHATRKPALTDKQFSWVEGGGCFWHMVDLLWIVIFPLLFLVR